MPDKEPWNDKQKARSKRRLEYFREYRRLHRQYASHGTSLGYKGEEIAQEYMKGAIKIHRPCDYSWNGKLIDIKTSIKTKMTNKHVNGERVEASAYRWKFLLTQKGKVDLFFIICKDIEDKVQYIFLIPDAELKCKNLSISENQIHKYSKYLLALS